MTAPRVFQAMRLSVTAAILLATVASCSVNSATGKRQFNLLSQNQEVQLGEEAAPQFLEAYGGQIPSEQVSRYVADVGQRLAALSERPNLPWRFYVVDSAVINAFALPGGKIFVTRGLLARLDNEAELAGVLGHEIGHVTAQHIGQQLSRQVAIETAAQAAGAVGASQNNDLLRALGVGTQIGGTVYLLRFGRDQESQADALGVRYMTRADYNPEGQAQVLEMLEQVGKDSPHPPEILSTHPAPEKRVAAIDKLIESKYKDDLSLPLRRNAYHENVLAQLARLPPPRQTEPPSETQQGGQGQGQGTGESQDQGLGG